MAKYHVGKDGQARPCKAASPDSCPLAKADGSGVVKHFDDMADAQAYGERVVMGLADESPAQEAPVSGMRDDGHYVDDSGHVYPKMGSEWSDDDRAAYVAQAARGAVEAGAFDPDDPSTEDLKSLAAGDYDWDDIQRERQSEYSLLDGESIMLDRQWEALDSQYPVITDDGDVHEADDSERPATDDEISEYVRSVNADSLQNDVSISRTSEQMSDDYYFEDMSDAERDAVRADLDVADDAVAAGDFEEASSRYQAAADKLGYDYGMASFSGPASPVRDRIRSRWDMADGAAYGEDMSDLPDDPAFDDERDLEPGTFSISSSGVSSLDLDDDEYQGALVF